MFRSKAGTRSSPFRRPRFAKVEPAISDSARVVAMSGLDLSGAGRAIRDLPGCRGSAELDVVVRDTQTTTISRSSSTCLCLPQHTRRRIRKRRYYFQDALVGHFAGAPMG